MFIGREYELKNLNTLYETNKFQFIVMLGRRRVGKTALINEFIKEREAIYFTGLETNTKQNLENFSKSIFSYATDIENTSVFTSFQDALEYSFKLSLSKRLILVIDEYPYVARSYKGFASILQVLTDKYKDISKMFLVICGSSMSFMEEQVLGYKSPLYGRRTAQFRIAPFDFFESCKYYENFSKFEMAHIYGIVGGTPQYLLQIDDKLSVEDNIKNNYLKTTSYLFEEPNNLLQQEVREPAIYNAVISAIAAGSTKLSEIAGKVGEETSVCSAYLKNLISLGIIKKEIPVGEKKSKKTTYSVADNMFRFWYRFVPQNMSIIQKGMITQAYKNISEQISVYMGAVFEDICREYLWKMNIMGEAPITFNNIGRWWGNDPLKQKESEIDILATDDKGGAIFGECKWINEKVDITVLETLTDRSRLFQYKNKYLYIFAKTGFSSGCMKYAKNIDAKLVSFENMF